MYIKKIYISNFRNITKSEINPSHNFNVLWGENAQGKTNFLESIYLLGNLRSFRCNKNEEIINYNNEESNIIGEIISNNVYRRLEMTLRKNNKDLKVDKKNVKSVGNFLDHLRPVLFSPEEVGLIKGIPAGRRSLLDRAIFQVDPSFLNDAQQYDRCLRQRNKLLKEGKEDKEIAPWTEHLIVTGTRIRLERLRYIERLVPLLREIYNAIAGGGENADLIYPIEIKEENYLLQHLHSEFLKLKARERIYGQTMCGPHRDDPLFLVNGRPLRIFGSQGQQRSYMLAFKTAQIIDLEQQRGEPPVLLLDDMTGELDRRRQGFFFRFLLERRGQVFITTTDIESLRQEGITDARFFYVNQGKIGYDTDGED